MGFRTDFLQPYTVHGGAIYSLADTAATHSLMTTSSHRNWQQPSEQRINFLKAVRGRCLL
jgi:acyl-coenzyme A thioesterase PaaI-like protein